MAQAKQLVRDGEFAEALRTYRWLIEQNESLAVAWADMAFVQYRLENFDEAVRLARRAIKIDAELAEAHATLGAAYVKRGEQQKAIRALKRAIDLDHDLAQAHSTLGAVLYRQQRLDLARAHLESAVHGDRELPEAHFNLGLVFEALALRKVRKGNEDPVPDRRRALEHFRRVVELNSAEQEHIDLARQRTRDIRSRLRDDDRIELESP